MSFWEGETCEYCGGPIVDRHVSLHRKIKGQYVLIEHVPAGVCKQCGAEREFRNWVEDTPAGEERRPAA